MSTELQTPETDAVFSLLEICWHPETDREHFFASRDGARVAVERLESERNAARAALDSVTKERDAARSLATLYSAALDHIACGNSDDPIADAVRALKEQRCPWVPKADLDRDSEIYERQIAELKKERDELAAKLKGVRDLRSELLKEAELLLTRGGIAIPFALQDIARRIKIVIE